MKDNELTRDSAAIEMFGHPWENLSSWGQQHVDEVLAKMGKINAPYNVSLNGSPEEPATLRVANEKLAGANEQLRKENLDLWSENESLRNELMELQEQWNPPGS